jgi:hypothetical protein
MSPIEHRFDGRIESTKDRKSFKSMPGRQLTAEQRDFLIRSVIGSQAIAGVDVTREEAELWLEECLSHKAQTTHRRC